MTRSERLTMRLDLVLPPRDSRSRCVSFESRYGTYGRPAAQKHFEALSFELNAYLPPISSRAFSGAINRVHKQSQSHKTESRKALFRRTGQLRVPSVSALMQFPSAESDWLIFFASSSVWPLAPVFLTCSEPARSARFNRLTCREKQKRARRSGDAAGFHFKRKGF